MSLWNAIVVGLKEIWAHKFRSMLTMLGIILGVSSLVAMSAMVKGMEVGARETLIAVGGLQKVRVEAQPVPPEQRHLRDFARGVTLHDVYALQSAPEVGKVSPEMRLNGEPVIAANGKTIRNWMTSGVWPVQLEMMQHTVAHGRMFNEIDDELARNVCVIGDGIRDDLWGKPESDEDEIIPIGKQLTINGYPFTIVGMFEHYEGEQDRRERAFNKAEKERMKAAGITNAASGPKRSRGWGGAGNRRGGFAFWIKNHTVYIPLNAMWMKLVSGMTNAPTEPKLSDMEIRIKDVTEMDRALTQIRNVMMVNHHGVEDFSFRTQEDSAEQINLYIKNARLSGGIIAGISLLVGGIGIMNIMLASISERIREIGIRKAVGAGALDVFVQIVVESVVIAMIGGFVGLGTSYALIQLIATITPTDNAPIITATAMAMAFAASVVVGVAAGLFPAFKAARMNVIQALRYD
jgi:putative ABC transport system permease protein